MGTFGVEAFGEGALGDGGLVLPAEVPPMTLPLPPYWSQTEFDDFYNELVVGADRVKLEYILARTPHDLQAIMVERLASGSTLPLPPYMSEGEWSEFYDPLVARSLIVWRAFILDRTPADIYANMVEKLDGLLAPTFAVWSPTDKVSSVVLSNGGLTATAINDGGLTFQSGRATIGIQTGAKKFFSLTVTALPTAATSVAIGLANATFAFAGFLGADFNAAAQYEADARVLINNGSVGAPTPWVLNNVIDIAVNRAANLYWSRINGGSWNANGAADPATNTGGFSLAAVAGVLFPAYQLLGDAGGNGRVVGNFGASAYGFPAPSGYTNL